MTRARGSANSSRRLLRELRDVMADGGSAQSRLDRIVNLIATGMIAEVCSCYVMRPGNILELFATEGLRAEAVHHTRLEVGEGLVGLVASRARPLALSDASTHPSFAYRPETGEERYSSLLGVPLLRGDKVLGVLVVQNRVPRNYIDEEIEALETVAMVVAELAAGGELLSPEDLRRAISESLQPVRLVGVRFNPGLAMGRVVLHRPNVLIHRIVADNPEWERQRLLEARAAMHQDLDDLLESNEIVGVGEQREILESYRMFAADRGWLARIEEAIRTGLTAEAAVERVRRDTHARMQQIRDPYLRERLQDLEDLANRLLRYLTSAAPAEPSVPGGADRHNVGESGIEWQSPVAPASDASPAAASSQANAHGAASALPEAMILVARSMGPAELLDYDRRCLKGLVLEEGAATSHVAIIARALDIPVVGRVQGVLERVEPGDIAVVDADNAQVLLRPTNHTLRTVEDALESRSQHRRAGAALRDLPAVSHDGVSLSLHLNAGLLADLAMLEEVGAEGIGLYRTEIPFMVRSSFPDVASQTHLYRQIMERAGRRPVIFRLLDAGGDKKLPYWEDMEEENPAMGWRAVRVSLDRPAMLRQQMRALLQAAEGGPLTLMFPMISEVDEFVRGRRLLDMELEREASRGRPLPSPLRVGAMLEVPALIFQLPTLLARADFLAIGSNDLCQFLFASDRANPRMAHRYDPLSPAVLRVLREVVQICEKAGKPVSLCGEMASQPLEAMALIGLGLRNLSMTASAIAPVKAMVRSLDIGSLAEFMAPLYDLPDRSLRERFRCYAMDHGIDL